MDLVPHPLDLPLVLKNFTIPLNLFAREGCIFKKIFIFVALLGLWAYLGGVAECHWQHKKANKIHKTKHV